MDAPSRQYVHEVTRHVRGTLGTDLVGVYLIGSAVLGDWRAGTSDIDVMVVCRASLTPDAGRALVEPLWQRTLPCPARGLELVVYRREALRAPGPAIDFEVNLNTGPGMVDRASFDPADEPRHWFVIDVAIARDHARSLCGPPPANVIGPSQREVVLAALADSVRWHREHDPAGAGAVLNACRAWRYAATGEWTSKSAAAGWAVERGGGPVIGEALAMRQGRRGDHLDRSDVLRLLDDVDRRLAG